ncbi:MAG: sulfatase-like hydrolase/transferase [Chitinophagaceae bacterium]|nr:sulfatase-like hydrolase/transferase [Chitinophagaceae bacterium]
MQHEFAGFMKCTALPFNGKTIWQNNKAFFWFLLSLLLIYAVLKIIFYQYNRSLLFPDQTDAEVFTLMRWSLAVDLLTLLGINSFLLFALTLGRLVNPKISAWVIIPAFVLINSFSIILNLADIFYFRFHFQRANADLLYVIGHPADRLQQLNFFIIVLIVIGIAAIIYLVWLLHRKFFKNFLQGQHAGLCTALLLIILGLPFAFKKHFTKYGVPTYPMLSINSSQLAVVQNSFHTFIYSVFRTDGGIPKQDYLSPAACDSLMPIRKKLTVQTGVTQKNIVLFIMESVPYDFFDSSSAYKIAMPFFDSIISKSSFFSNAFSFAHESNKGITAILAGTPTITEMPVYHSPYINMPVTPIGTVLKKLNYRSIFCIGDEYDNFGFAKCMNWLGFDKYYSKEDIPGYKKLPAHPMGLQDEYTLDFFRKKIDEQQTPFLAVHYNISTHYPYSLPASFTSYLPENYTAPMNSMRYYDHSLQQFFKAAQKEPWFNNTLFIFCSDHWLVPDDKNIQFNAISGFRIPIILYDVATGKPENINAMVSQFDIMGTILAAAGYRDSIISYGGNLQDLHTISPFVYARPNSTLYQVADSNFVLGYNIITNKAEYLYNYKQDIHLQHNLVAHMQEAATLNSLTLQVQAFVQKAAYQYRSNAFK